MYHLYQYEKYLQFHDYYHLPRFLMILFQEEMEVRVVYGIDTFGVLKFFSPDLELDTFFVEA